MSSILLTHRGAEKVSRAELGDYEPPPGTPTWTPVKHSALVTALHATLNNHDIAVTREEYAVTRHANLLFGVMDLDYQCDHEKGASLGLRTSNDKSMSIQIAVGARVFVCDNMVFAADLIALKRKHTKDLDIQIECSQAIDRYLARYRNLDAGIQSLKNTPLTNAHAKAIIFDIFDKQIVPIRLFYPIVREYRQHSRDATQWTLHNAFTAHLKTLPPAAYFRATIALGKYFGLS